MNKDIEWQRQVNELTRRCEQLEQAFKNERWQNCEMKEAFTKFVIGVLKEHKTIDFVTADLIPLFVELRIQELTGRQI